MLPQVYRNNVEIRLTFVVCISILPALNLNLAIWLSTNQLGINFDKQLAFEFQLQVGVKEVEAIKQIYIARKT